jgi:phospholipase D1/2
MSESVHPSIGSEGDLKEKSYSNDFKKREEYIDRERRFEELRQEAYGDHEIKSKDSISQDAMLNAGKVTEELWEGDAETEKENFIQEELYIHGKVCIIDDRVVICGSANINDRVRIAILFLDRARC